MHGKAENYKVGRILLLHIIFFNQRYISDFVIVLKIQDFDNNFVVIFKNIKNTVLFKSDILTWALNKEFHFGTSLVQYGIIKGGNTHEPFKDNQSD